MERLQTTQQFAVHEDGVILPMIVFAQQVGQDQNVKILCVMEKPAQQHVQELEHALHQTLVIALKDMMVKNVNSEHALEKDQMTQMFVQEKVLV